MSSENQEVAATEQAPTLSGDNTPKENTDWKANLSDEIRNEKSLENISDIESLAKSFVHAQKLVGADKIPVPNKYATEDDWNKVYEKLGRPKSADEYKFNLPEDKTVDEAALKGFAQQAHKLGLLPGQADGVVKFYNDMIGAELADANSIAVAAREKATSELKKEWGQAYNQKLEAANNVVRSVLPDGFMSMQMEDGSKLGDNPVVIKAFAMLAEKMGEDKIVQADGPMMMTPKQLDKEINSLTAPGSAYWDKNHPGHQDAVAEVLALREQKSTV
tara:strand:- start:9483 stop:10307 length:825 start_codon:yes stop_codon:yes gene_type:complete